MAVLLVPMAIGALIGGGINAADQYYSTGTVKWGGLGGVIDAAGDGALFGMAGARGASVESTTVTVSRSKYPESASHIEDAIQSGQPSTLTIDRSGAAARRRDALKGTKSEKGLDRDEYPPAMFKEGGEGASVRSINPSDNRGAGACIGAQCRGVADGSKVKMQVGE